VLARELNLQQIKAIYDNTDATIEFFIHGALCVAYSGQCNIPTPRPGAAPTAATARRPAVAVYPER
jgi:putative protease